MSWVGRSLFFTGSNGVSSRWVYTLAPRGRRCLQCSRGAEAVDGEIYDGYSLALVTKETVTVGGSPRRYAVLSIAAAVLTIGLKLGAYFLTGSWVCSPTRPSRWSTWSRRWRRCGLCCTPPVRRTRSTPSARQGRVLLERPRERANIDRCGLDRHYRLGPAHGPAAFAQRGYRSHNARRSGDQRHRGTDHLARAGGGCARSRCRPTRNTCSPTSGPRWGWCWGSRPCMSPGG